MKTKETFDYIEDQQVRTKDLIENNQFVEDTENKTFKEIGKYNLYAKNQQR